MHDLFFYGTLRHKPLLHIVLGGDQDHIDISEAHLNGHQARAVAGEDFPMIVEMEGRAQGLLCRNLSNADLARLTFYEGGFEYELRDVTVETAHGPRAAQVFFPLASDHKDAGVWGFSGWVDAFGDLATLAAQEVMSFAGTASLSEITFMFPMIRARAAAQLAAAKTCHALSPSGFTRADTIDHGFDTPHTGFFQLKRSHVSYRQYDQNMSPVITREVFIGGDASIVLPYDAQRDRVMLVEQFRPGPYLRRDQKPWMLEPIAGRIDPGETPEESAHREAKEEADLELKSLHAAAKCYASPGCSTEFFHIFIGCCDLPDDAVGIHGLDAESEDIKSYLFSFDELMEMVEKYQAANTPLVLAALWLARHRDRLRSAA